jgi:hypothetical protein
MATIVSQGKTNNPKIEWREKNFRDMEDTESKIYSMYVSLAHRLIASGKELPMWVYDVLNIKK